jgi:hypothetical protein
MCNVHSERCEPKSATVTLDKRLLAAPTIEDRKSYAAALSILSGVCSLFIVAVRSLLYFALYNPNYRQAK